MKTLETIPKTYSEDLINDFNMFFETYKMDDLYDYHIGNYTITANKWYEVYESLKHLFRKYYIVNDDNYDLETPEEVKYGGGICKLNSKYKEKYVKDVYEIFIKSAYPQKINKLFLEGMKSDDGYLPYIFNIVYQHIGKQKKSSIINLFINFTYGALTISREKYIDKLNYLPRVDKDLKKDVSIYYRDVMGSIDDNLYYYIDTDVIYTKKENIEDIVKVFKNNDIEYDIEDKCSNYLFLERKRYIEIGGKFNRQINYIKGINFINFFNRCEIKDNRVHIC